MPPNLAVVDNTALATMDKFQGVFNRDDMILTVLIGVIDDCCEGSRFSTSRRTRNQDKPFLKHGELSNDMRQAQLFSAHDCARDEAEDRTDPMELPEEVGTVARQPRDLIGEIDIS